MDQNAHLLLFNDDPSDLIRIATALRLRYFVVLPARSHEHGVDALARIHPRIALVPADHEAAHSPAFAEAAAKRDVRVVLYAREGDPPFDPTRAVLRYDGDPNDLADRLIEAVNGVG